MDRNMETALLKSLDTLAGGIRLLSLQIQLHKDAIDENTDALNRSGNPWEEPSQEDLEEMVGSRYGVAPLDGEDDDYDPIRLGTRIESTLDSLTQNLRSGLSQPVRPMELDEPPTLEEAAQQREMTFQDLTPETRAAIEAQAQAKDAKVKAQIEAEPEKVLLDTPF